MPDELQEVNEDRILSVMIAVSRAMNGTASPEDWVIICRECNINLVSIATYQEIT
jgi:hypothetical protein